MASNNNEKISSKGFIFAVAMFSVTALGVGGLQCENGFVVATRERRVGDEITMIQVCCQDVTCGPGEKAVACEEDDPYSSECVPCETGTRQETRTTLAMGSTSCEPNVDCNKRFRVTKFAGNSTSNSVCGDCFLGYRNANNQQITKECLVNNCPPGQEPERDGCQNCSSMHFSATMDYLPCKKRTNCSAEGKCTKREGNITHDNECSTDVSYCKNAANDTTSVQLWHDWYIAPIVLSILVAVTVAGVIVYLKKRNIERRREREKRPSLAVVIMADTDTPSGQTTENLQGAPSEIQPGHPTETQLGHPTTTHSGHSTAAHSGPPTIAPPGHSTTAQPGHPTASQPGHSTAAQPRHPTVAPPGHFTAAQLGHPTIAPPEHYTASQPRHPMVAPPGHSTATQSGLPTASQPGHPTVAPSRHSTAAHSGPPTIVSPGHSMAAQPVHPTSAQLGHSTNNPSGSYTKPTECTEGREDDKKTSYAPNYLSGTLFNHSTAKGNFSAENELGRDSRTSEKNPKSTTGNATPPPTPTPSTSPPRPEPIGLLGLHSVEIDSLKFNSDPDRNGYDP